MCITVHHIDFLVPLFVDRKDPKSLSLWEGALAVGGSTNTKTSVFDLVSINMCVYLPSDLVSVNLPNLDLWHFYRFVYPA
jgi:hypothetical protein